VRRERSWLALVTLAAVAAACSSAGDGGGSGGSGGSGISGGAPGGVGRGGSGGSSGGSAGGSAGGGGSSTGGSGGGSGGSGVGGSGGFGGGGDAAADGGVRDSNPAPGDAQANPCTVTITPLAPQRWANLAAAPGSKLRVGATASGFKVPSKPTFDWKVTYNGQIVATSVVGGDPAVVEFETGMVGQYHISVTVAGVTPACTDTEVAGAVPPNNLVAVYLIRAIAPESRGLAPLEEELPVSVGGMPSKTLELRRGQEIIVTAMDERAELPAYLVQLRSRDSTARLEGFIDASLPIRRSFGFRAHLDVSMSNQRYDLLVIPAPDPGAGIRAPQLYPGLLHHEIQLQDYLMRPGTRVSGTISAAGVPLPLARVRLRDGLLPSTIGTTIGNGSYELRVRGGRLEVRRFEVRVLPPPDSGLPEAQLPESAGVTIAEDAAEVPLDFQYGALPTSRLELTVNTPAGTPVGKSVQVLLQSLEGELGNVGNFAFAGSTVTGSGSVRLLRPTDGATVAFERVPHARYRVTVAPPPDLPGELGITSEEIDLRAAGATVAHTIALKARTMVQGRLTGMAPIVGLKVRASDAGEDGFGRTTIVNVGSDGLYTIAADIDRLYRVSLEPTADRSVPRIPLIPFRARVGAPVNSQALPRILTVKGQALGEGQPPAVGRQPLAGAVIQIYCQGNAPDCVADDSPDISNTLPIDETVSDPDGNYDLRIPEPN
jgi:hypothetical protein